MIADETLSTNDLPYAAYYYALFESMGIKSFIEEGNYFVV